jgi:hypothetical protein
VIEKNSKRQIPKPKQGPELSVYNNPPQVRTEEDGRNLITRRPDFLFGNRVAIPNSSFRD